MRLGLIGRSIHYSRSPELFHHYFEQEDIQGRYHLVELSLISQIRTILEHGNFHGLNVTIPYKKSIIPYLNGVTDRALKTQAVNCVYKTENGWHGDNTDVAGVHDMLDVHPISAGAHALIFGTGGAARAVVYALTERNIAYSIVSRHAGPDVLTYSDLNATIIQEHQLLVQCTPVGTSPHIDDKISIPYDAIHDKHILMDVVYNPEETAYLRAGRQQGAKTVSGMIMLKRQAEEAWNIWKKRQ